MTAPRDPDRLIHGFLIEGEDELLDPVYDAVRAGIEQKRQRAVIGQWRAPTMNRFVTLGLGAAAVVVLLFIGAAMRGAFSGLGVFPGGQPSPSAAPSESAALAGPFLPEGSFTWFHPLFGPEPLADLPPIRVTIPTSGWTCPEGGYQACILNRGGGLDGLAVPASRLPESAFLATATTAGIHVLEDPCQWQYNVPDPPVTTAEEIAAALAVQPSRDASGPVDVTVGGYPGKEVTVHVPDDLAYDPAADGFSECFRGLYVSYTVGDNDAPGGLPTRWHQAPGQIDTFWIVDVDGAVVIIDGMYRPDTSAERIVEMRAIAESATFEFP